MALLVTPAAAKTVRVEKWGSPCDSSCSEGEFDSVYGISIGPSGEVFVADSGNLDVPRSNRIQVSKACLGLESPDLMDRAIPGRPVVVVDALRHAALVKNERLRAAGLADGRDPAGGAIVRDSSCLGDRRLRLERTAGSLG